MPQQRNFRGRGPHQLPAGRHNLSREDVKANQRGRILDAVADVVSLTGYPATSVEGITAAAGVSRRTFYDCFRGKEEAFLAALEQACDELLERLRRAFDVNETFAGGVRDCVATFAQFVAEDPRRADMLIIEVLAAGPAAIQRRNEMMRTLSVMLEETGRRIANGTRVPGLVAETAIGGIYEVAYSRVLQGESEALVELVPDLAYSILQPYIGHEQAWQEAARAAEAVAPAA